MVPLHLLAGLSGGAGRSRPPGDPAAEAPVAAVSEAHGAGPPMLGRLVAGRMVKPLSRRLNQTVLTHRELGRRWWPAVDDVAVDVAGDYLVLEVVGESRVFCQRDWWVFYLRRHAG